MISFVKVTANSPTSPTYWSDQSVFKLVSMYLLPRPHQVTTETSIPQQKTQGFGRVASLGTISMILTPDLAVERKTPRENRAPDQCLFFTSFSFIRKIFTPKYGFRQRASVRIKGSSCQIDDSKVWWQQPLVLFSNQNLRITLSLYK